MDNESGTSKSTACDRSRKALGNYGEGLAARYLTDLGLQVIDRNWRVREGELDLVAIDGNDIVVCEVKTRSGEQYGGALAAVDRQKLARLRRLAMQWLAEHPLRYQSVRIDVIAITRPPRGPVKVQHIRGVE